MPRAGINSGPLHPGSPPLIWSFPATIPGDGGDSGIAKKNDLRQGPVNQVDRFYFRITSDTSEIVTITTHPK
jgi:hypothetical protein